MISSFNAFDKVLGTYDPDLLVVSGLQMMDNYPFREGSCHQTIIHDYMLNKKFYRQTQESADEHKETDGGTSEFYQNSF